MVCFNGHLYLPLKFWRSEKCTYIEAWNFLIYIHHIVSEKTFEICNLRIIKLRKHSIERYNLLIEISWFLLVPEIEDISNRMCLKCFSFRILIKGLSVYINPLKFTAQSVYLLTKITAQAMTFNKIVVADISSSVYYVWDIVTCLFC